MIHDPEPARPKPVAGQFVRHDQHVVRTKRCDLRFRVPAGEEDSELFGDAEDRFELLFLTTASPLTRSVATARNGMSSRSNS